MKTCRICNIEKPKTDFSRHKQTRDRLRHECKDCRKIESREYNRLDPEYSSIRKQIYYLENRERLSEKRREYYKENKEAFARRARKYAENNPCGISANSAKRRSIELSAPGSHSAEDAARIFSLQRGFCASCKQKLLRSGANRYHLDHIIPLSRGGSNDKYNLQCLCPTCNLRKHAKDPIAWARENGRLL